MARIRRVGAVIRNAYGYGRAAGVGVRRYAHERDDWELRVIEPDLEPVGTLADWEPHGIVGYIAERDLAREVSRLDIPVVNISHALDDLPFPTVTVDNAGVGRQAAGYLAGLGLPSFAVVARSEHAYAREREAGFLEALRESGREARSFHPGEGDWRGEMRRWLVALPRPTGLFACNDFVGYHVAQRSIEAGILVPNELAILAADNEEHVSELARPPLSSVRIPGEEVGREAARLLDRLMAGKPAPKGPILLPPLPVAERESSRVEASGDEVVGAALSYIAGHAHENPGVEQVAAAVAVGRRTLERRFRAQLGRSINQYIRHARLSRVKRMLAETDLTLDEISEKAGFGSAQHLWEFFRDLEGAPPGAFRRRFAPADPK